MAISQPARFSRPVSGSVHALVTNARITRPNDSPPGADDRDDPDQVVDPPQLGAGEMARATTAATVSKPISTAAAGWIERPQVHRQKHRRDQADDFRGDRDVERHHQRGWR